MRAISIKQPWAELIVAGFKDIENRSWHTKIRGRVLIHASKGIDKAAMREVEKMAAEAEAEGKAGKLDRFHLRGGIVGSVEIVDCVTNSDSDWFHGPYGFVLRAPRCCNFIECSGSQRWFNVPIVFKD